MLSIIILHMIRPSDIIDNLTRDIMAICCHRFNDITAYIMAPARRDAPPPNDLAGPSTRPGTDGLPDLLRLLRSADPRAGRPVDSDGRTSSLAASSGRPPQAPAARRGPGHRDMDVPPYHPPHFIPNPNHNPTTPYPSRWTAHSQLHPRPPMGVPFPALSDCSHPPCSHGLGPPPPRVEGGPAPSRRGLLLGPLMAAWSIEYMIEFIPRSPSPVSRISPAIM